MSAMTPIDIRERAQKCAINAISSQLQDFRRWGIKILLDFYTVIHI